MTNRAITESTNYTEIIIEGKSGCHTDLRFKRQNGHT